MKYTIEGFNQEILIDMGLDTVDAVMLRYVIDFYSTGKMVKVEVDGKQYFWVKYGTIIEEIPIIRIKNKVAIARRFQKYVECGLMEKVVYQNAGNYTCFRLTDRYESLISKVQGSTQKYKGYALESTEGMHSKVQTKDSSSKDQSTKKLIYPPEFKTFWNEYPRNTNKVKAFKCWTANLKKGDTPESMILAARHYASKIKADKTEPNFILHASTFLGPDRRFEDFDTAVKTDEIPMGYYVDKNDTVYQDGVKIGHYDGSRMIPAAK